MDSKIAVRSFSVTGTLSIGTKSPKTRTDAGVSAFKCRSEPRRWCSSRRATGREKGMSGLGGWKWGKDKEKADSLSMSLPFLNLEGG